MIFKLFPQIMDGVLTRGLITASLFLQVSYRCYIFYCTLLHNFIYAFKIFYYFQIFLIFIQIRKIMCMTVRTEINYNWIIFKIHIYISTILSRACARFSDVLDISQLLTQKLFEQDCATRRLSQEYKKNQRLSPRTG